MLNARRHLNGRHLLDMHPSDAIGGAQRPKASERSACPAADRARAARDVLNARRHLNGRHIHELTEDADLLVCSTPEGI